MADTLQGFAFTMMFADSPGASCLPAGLTTTVGALAPLSSLDVELVDRLEGLAGADKGLLWQGNLSIVHQGSSDTCVDDMLQEHTDTTFVTFKPLLSLLLGKTHALISAVVTLPPSENLAKVLRNRGPSLFFL